MSQIKIVEDDILNSKEKYLVHQENSVSVGAAGLAYVLFKNYPWAAKGYENHKIKHDEPGTIFIYGDGIKKRFVIGLRGQFEPSGIDESEGSLDTEELRHKYFYNGLKLISQIPNLESLAFPWLIGCGLAGGNWEQFYYPLLQKFALSLGDKVEVVLYKKDM